MKNWAFLNGGDINPGERHSRVTQDDGTVTRCGGAPCAPPLYCHASVAQILVVPMSHSRDGQGVTAPLRTNIDHSGVHKRAVSKRVVLSKKRLLQKFEGKFSEQVGGEIFGDFWWSFIGAFFLGEKRRKQSTKKTHSKFQIRIWKFRGQNPHCKDLDLGRCSLDPQNRNEGTKRRNNGTKNGTRVHSPKPPFSTDCLFASSRIVPLTAVESPPFRYPDDPAALKDDAIVKTLCAENIPSHNDLLLRPPCADINFL